MATETELERMMVRLLGDSSELKRMLQEAQREVAAAADAVEKTGKKIENIQDRLESFSRFMSITGDQFLKVGASIGAIAAPLTGLGTAAAFSAGKFEQTTIAFETMLGSVEETKKLLAELTDFAAKTPFEMPEIQVAARGLVQFGERGDDLIETLNILGNAAAGTSTQFGMVALIFNQIRGVGKLLTQDFRQLATRGILSLQDIADHFGVATGAAQKMLSEGKVGFEDVRAILKRLSEEGGRFANLMERQSQSFLGLISTLKDNINIMIRGFGVDLLPVLKSVTFQINAMTEAVTNLDKATRSLIIGVGALVVGLSSLALGLGATFKFIAFAVEGLRSLIALVTKLAALIGIGASGLSLGFAVLAAAGGAVAAVFWNMAKGAKAAADSIEDIGKGVSTLDLSPIEAMRAKIAELSKELNRLEKEREEDRSLFGLSGEVGGVPLTGTATRRRGEIDRISKELDDAGKQLSDLVKAKRKEMAKDLEEGEEPSFFDTLDEVAKKSLESLAKSLTEKFKDPAERIRDQITEVSNAMKAGLIPMSVYTKALAELDKELKKITDPDSARFEEIGKTLTEKFKTPLEKLRDEADLVTDAFERGVISLLTYERAVDDIAKRVAELEAPDLTVPGSRAVAATGGRFTTAGVSATLRGAEGFARLTAIAERREKIAIAHARISEAILAETISIKEKPVVEVKRFKL